ncbi:2-dehydropantoate 2-reductase N-terminal domain-containing protein [uncultured Paludibaculum sp.]|uniref:ketopantoate reductase family protein n=1 Tax=uncultured Paludibaculum sp. TaxID=1765020 RepID=UPI002AAC2D8D|nr:2-dehydropantoate 2-reductase N-terminal domain-containing protein [uncultured Paludibaculum sp.]
MQTPPNSLNWSTPPRVLVYGAGVVGTLFASRLKRAGQDVTVLARGRRLTDIREHGLVLENQSTDERTVTLVTAIDHLAPDSTYDLIFVVMRKNQVDAVLPALAAARKVSTICFMVNTASGYTMWSEAVGRERLLLGFPGAGGVREGPVVRYAFAPTWMQPTTFGEPAGQVTARLKAVLRMFRSADLPVTTCSDMRAWLTSHVALVSPLANGIYLAGGGNCRLAKQVDTVRLMVDAIREGFAVVRAAGLNVVPFQLRLVERTPEALVVSALRAWAGTGHFETVAKAHAIAAADEMRVLAHEFALLARTVGVRTPAIDRLREACDIFARRP